MNTATISFDLNTTDPQAQLGFEFWIDDILVSDIDHVAGPQHLYYEVDDSDETQHQLKLVLKNKTWDHTQLDQAGNIVKDAQLEITNVKFDGIELGHLFVKLNQYHHQNNNPDSDVIVDKLYQTMGCNGYVTLNFSTPIYLWLLENM